MGATFKLIKCSDKVCDVNGFHETLGKLTNIPIGTTATTYDRQETQETIILVFPQSLYFGAEMHDSLLSPNQIRMNRIVVDTCPRQYSNGNSMHGIYMPKDDIYLPFKMHGCISYLPTRLPTDSELHTCKWVYMTDEREWDPYSSDFATAESAYDKLKVHQYKSSHEHHDLYGHTVNANSSLNHRVDVDVSTLARCWGTGEAAVKATLQVTTQWGFRSYTMPLTQWFWMRQAQLHYPHLQTKVYSDTMFSDVKSIIGNKCAQVFVTTEGYSKAYPMKSKAEAGDKLNEFIKSIGIPEHIITDNAGEESGGSWERVCKYYLLKQTFMEPHSPWQNRAEYEIRELKKHY